MADALVTISLGKSTDCTAGSQITIKAVRWIATHAGVQALKVSWSPLVESFLKSRIPKELKESLPFSLFAMVQLERRILVSSCSTYEVVLIGAILVCTWAGLRFADAQRCSYRTMCFDGKSLRGTCWRTKTSSRGQPWGIISSGMLSLDSFSWVEKWFVTGLSFSTGPERWSGGALGPHVICSGSGVDQKADCIALEVANSAIIAVDSQLHEKHDVVMGVTNGSFGDGLPRRKTAPGTPQTERESQPASLFQGRCAWPIGLPVQSRRACPPRWPLYHPIASGGPTPTVEPGVQMEFFRKSSLDYTWKCFNFLETPDATAQEVSDGPLFDSGSDRALCRLSLMRSACRGLRRKAAKQLSRMYRMNW